MGFCGPESGLYLLGIQVNVPDFLFNASCEKHDELYTKGSKEIDRYVADLLFYHYMKIDCKYFAMKQKYLLYKIILFVYYRFWAFIFYLAVRYGGNKYFAYK